MDGPPPPPDAPAPQAGATPGSTGSTRPKTPGWQWFAVAIATILIVAAVVIAATQLGDDDAGTADPSGRSDPVASGAEDTTPAISAPGASGAPDATGGTAVVTGTDVGEGEGVGHRFELTGGATVRVAAVVPNAPEPEGVFEPPAEVSITRLVVEGCAGDTRYSFGPEAWVGYLDDLEPAEAFVGANDVVEITPSPGGCVRFQLGYAVPAGRFLKNLAFAVGGDELERWELTFGRAPTDTLAGAAPPEAADAGDTAELPNGATVVLRSVDVDPTAVDADSTPPEGHRFVVIDGQVCAGTVPVRVRPFSWLVTATDNRVGTNIFAPSTFPSTELAAGQCGWGTVHLLLPADANPAYVIFTDADGAEVARWRVAA